MDNWATTAAERLALADDLDGLTPGQWQTPSLCGEWTVRELLGHLVAPFHMSRLDAVKGIAKHRGNFDAFNAELSKNEGCRPTADLLADLRANVDHRFTPPTFGSEAPITDIAIHSLDARIPLGIENPRPTEIYRVPLDTLMMKRARIGFVKGKLPNVRFIASDLDWSHGTGPTVEGPAADLMLSIAGRTARLDRLTGDGAPSLGAWIRG